MIMEKYKCPICGENVIFKGLCYDCFSNPTIRKKHEEKLEKKRKYYKGEEIKSIDEMLKQEFVYLGNKISHISFVKSMTLRTILKMKIYYALKKEGKNDRD